MRLIGEIVEYQGMLCIQTRPGVWWPLGGNSGLAHDFCEVFGPPMPCDKGKRVYKVGGVLQMENAEQLAARRATEVQS
jgi:hypothetical protein